MLFDGQMNPHISDIGLQGLKKYMSLKHGYSNKTHFTAPEHLNDKSTVVRSPTSKSDIYSFAFVVYELFMERQAFERRLTIEELKKTIIEDNSRPKIDDSPGKVPKEVATIIRYCWLSDPMERPEIRDVIDNLLKIFPQFCKDSELLYDDQDHQSLRKKKNLKRIKMVDSLSKDGGSQESIPD